MKLEWKHYEWNELNSNRLYAILQLRSEVFVVEQDCIYQDIDGKDRTATHLLGYEQKHLVAYSRIFNPGDYFKEHSFGRAVIKQTHRGLGLGDELIKQSIQILGEHTEIKISAQHHLEKFYQKHEFISRGETYLEDGIPHIAMFRNPSTF